MPRMNQFFSNTSLSWFICYPCDRWFVSEQALLQHCRHASTHHGEWCERCEWLFVSQDARQAHVRDSSQHWICHLCDVDEWSRGELVAHYANNHKFCYDCDEHFKQYVDHRIASHHRCHHCNREFDDHNQVIMHHQVHEPRDEECYGCIRTFASDSGIMLHLESGNCISGVTKKNLKTWAFECHQSRYYTNDINGRFPYHCPVCDANFAYISSLFQHIESPTCGARYKGSIAQLRRHLMVKVLYSDLEIDSGYSSPDGYLLD